MELKVANQLRYEKWITVGSLMNNGSLCLIRLSNLFVDELPDVFNCQPCQYELMDMGLVM